MIVTTTSDLQNKTIIEYRGIVFGESIKGINFLKDFTASFVNFTGGRAEEYEEELIASRAEAVKEMVESAKKIGANALIGVSIDTESITVGEKGQVMLMVVATGTAVVVE